VDGIDFHLSRQIRNGHVYKMVDFVAEGRQYHFEERVRLFTLTGFEAMLAAAGLTLRRTYGGYDPSVFDREHSERLIMIAQKTMDV
jgi:hypothetical protein